MIRADSRLVKKGDTFVAIKGLTVDSHDFIDDVINRGAKVVVGEKNLKLPKQVKYIKVENSRKALGELASEYYRHPSHKMKVIGVTGTDGKTTTSFFLYQILKKAGLKVGLISTTGAYIGSREYDTGFHVTNPEALDLHRFLAKMVEEGCEYAIIETTSHGIDQERVAGVKYDIAVLTNVTKEHLDYHKTFSNLVNTKAKLFERSRIAVLNQDDKSAKVIAKKLSNQKVVYYTKLRNLKTNIQERYNLYNLSAAISVARELEISDLRIRKAILKLELPKGRMQFIKNDRDLNIIVDFAHTPNALKNALKNLRKRHNNGKLIAVFGCAGERDRSKRPMMARISTDIADFSIFTAEDPRHEDLDQIISEMESGARKKNYKIIKDRLEAIKYATGFANKGDIVVIFGKGHEQSMNFNGTEKPWSDEKAVLEILSKNKYSDKKVAVLGFGKEGQEVAEYLNKQKAKITIFDRNKDIRKNKRYKYILGENYLEKLSNFDYIFRSPGFYRYLPEIIKAEEKGSVITSETKLFFEKFKGKIIAVTGTNGKGTTSTLIYEILKKAGKDVNISGNIGINNLLNILETHNNKNAYAILELSSFQLIDLNLGPHISVVLNITTDHLDWHKNRQEYVTAKSQLVRYQTEDDFAVINKDYKTSRNFAKLTEAKIIYFSKNQWPNYKTSLIGDHNKENILAAAAVAKILKINDSLIKQVVENYRPMPHRLEFVRDYKGIDFYNDSCSTSSQPAIAAIKSFKKPITLILGGSDKGLEFYDLAKAINKSSVKNIILIGQIANKLESKLRNFKGNIINLGMTDMREIVDTALRVTSQNEIALLSPAAASFGMFQNYADRGDQFKEYVKKLS